MKIDHVGIDVDDLYIMELFYRRMFGFNCSYRYTSKNTPGLKTVFMEKDGTVIELLHHEDEMPSMKVKPCHIAFEVEDVDKEHLRLSRLGANINGDPRNTGDGFREFSLKDPEGNIVEICRRVGPFHGYAIEAVIFDMDGTLIDSEDNYYEADRLLLEGYGVKFSPEMKKEFVGSGNLPMMAEMKKRYGIADSPEEMARIKNGIYLDIARKNTKAYPKMLQLLTMLKKEGYPMAVASGSAPEVIDALLEITSLDEYFGFAVSSESAGRGKPAPDVFVAAGERLGLNPINILVIEDSQYGVEAAVRANMQCAAVPYITEKPLADSFMMADILFEDGMDSFSAEALMQWIKGRSTLQ